MYFSWVRSYLIYAKIRIKIWHTAETYGTSRYLYTISHHVHAPGQANPHQTSNPFGDTEESALHKAIRDFFSF